MILRSLYMYTTLLASPPDALSKTDYSAPQPGMHPTPVIQISRARHSSLLSSASRAPRGVWVQRLLLGTSRANTGVHSGSRRLDTAEWEWASIAAGIALAPPWYRTLLVVCLVHLAFP
ncbi:hypothetical protein K438DRAFT_1756685 [Mycena galopus ATCC 62051]|nr:hypothetical protein K438DRAFT_1756685 [Mycena galopus ATCC 62051]